MCKAGSHDWVNDGVGKMCRIQVMKGFVCYSEKFNPKGIKKVDLLKSIRKDTVSSPWQH